MLVRFSYKSSWQGCLCTQPLGLGDPQARQSFRKTWSTHTMSLGLGGFLMLGSRFGARLWLRPPWLRCVGPSVTAYLEGAKLQSSFRGISEAVGAARSTLQGTGVHQYGVGICDGGRVECAAICDVAGSIGAACGALR